MATRWVDETSAHAHQRAHEQLYPRKDLSLLLERRRGVEGPRHFTESKKDAGFVNNINNRSSRSPLVAASRAPSSTTLRRSSSGMLYRISSDGTLSRVQSRDSLPRVPSKTHILLTGNSNDMKKDNSATSTSFVSQPRAAVAQFVPRDLTLNVVSQRTEALLQQATTVGRNRTLNPPQHESDEYDFEAFESNTDGDPAVEEDSADVDADADDPLQTKVGPENFRHLFEVVFRGDIVALVGAFAAERFKRAKPRASSQPPSVYRRCSMATAAVAGVVAGAIATEGMDDGSAVTPNTRRIRDEKNWADGAGELYLEISAALLANKELRDLILGAEEFQKVVADEQAHVSLLQNHRTTPQSVFRHALEFFDRLPPTSKFLQGCVCVALSKCLPVASVLDIYDKQWRALLQGDRRRTSLLQLAGVKPHTIPSWSIPGALPPNAFADSEDDDAGADDDADDTAGIDDDDGESEDEDGNHYIDELILLPQFQRRKVTLAEKIADLSVAVSPRSPPAAAPEPTADRRARKPRLRPASGRDLLAKTYERSLHNLEASTAEKKRPVSSFGASTRVVWPTREWKVKKYDDFSFLSYSSGPAPGQEFLDRARQFELRIPIVRQISSARKSRGEGKNNTLSPAALAEGFGVAPRQRLGDSPRARRPSTVSGIASRIASARRLEIHRAPSQRGDIGRQASAAELQQAQNSQKLLLQQHMVQEESFVTEGGLPRPFTSPGAVGRGPFQLKREASMERMRELALEVLKEEDEDAKLRRTTKGWDTRFWWKHDAFALSDDKRSRNKGPRSSSGKRKGDKEGRSRSGSPHPPHVYRSAPPGLAPPEEQIPPLRRVPVLKLLFQSFLRELLVQTLAPPVRPQSAFPNLVNGSPKI